MSRPKVRTTEADQLIHDEALRRVQFRSNKQLAQILIEKGVRLTPNYVGELIKAEERRIRAEFSRRSNVSRGTTENEKSSGTIRE